MIETFLEILQYLKQQRKFWLAPFILVLLLLGFMLALAQNSVIAPFIYTLF